MEKITKLLNQILSASIYILLLFILGTIAWHLYSTTFFDKRNPSVVQQPDIVDWQNQQKAKAISENIDDSTKKPKRSYLEMMRDINKRSRSTLKSIREDQHVAIKNRNSQSYRMEQKKSRSQQNAEIKSLKKNVYQPPEYDQILNGEERDGKRLFRTGKVRNFKNKRSHFKRRN